MEQAEYGRIAAAEDEHWWYRATRALMADLLGQWLGHGQTLLDAGCGPGGNGAWLAAHGEVVGVDVSPDALSFVRARRPAVRPVRASIERLPFEEGSFDVAVEVTVLTIVADDALAVRELARVLRPGGALLLVEPAFRALRRSHDTVVHSRRRYSRKGLAGLAIRAGLTVTRTTYAQSFLLLPAAALAALDRLRPGPPRSDLERSGLDGVFARLAALERRVIARRAMPAGLSVFAVATKV